MTAKERRQAIVALLEERRPRGATTKELAERFGVSPRMILHDLMRLQGEPHYVPLVCEVRYEYRVK